LRKQIIEFMNNVPKMINGLQTQFNDIRDNRYLSMVTNETSPELMSKVTEYLNSAMEAISGYLSHVVTFLNDFVIVVGTVPILLYYMLKEDERVTPMLVRMLPSRYRRDGANV